MIWAMAALPSRAINSKRNIFFIVIIKLLSSYVEVGGDAGAVFEFYGADWRSRERAEPIEVREQFGEGKRRYLEKEASFSEQVAVGVLLAYNFGARPMEQAKGLHLVGGEVLSEQLINIA